MAIEAGALRHPAKFSERTLTVINGLLPSTGRILDPFAGTGRIHLLATETLETVGVEIEPEWAAIHPDTIVGDATALPFPDDSFDAIATSPVFGNRMSDHHHAKDGSRRITYRHLLGRPLHEDNAGRLQWGPRYRALHREAWAEAARVLRPDGVFVLNVSDHIRHGRRQHVTAWHVSALGRYGLEVQLVIEIEARRMRFGANGMSRVQHESVIRLQRV